jgi:hypothetical protein
MNAGSAVAAPCFSSGPGRAQTCSDRPPDKSKETRSIWRRMAHHPESATCAAQRLHSDALFAAQIQSCHRKASQSALADL